MIDFMNCNSKDKLIKQFFSWLLNKQEIELIADTDLSLASDYIDPNIYYPKEFEPFFESRAMQRLGRINQLGITALSIYPNTYHTRLEHSKAHIIENLKN